MTARKKPTPITVDAGQCLSLLTNVARAAGTDNWTPMINGVLLHGDVHDGKPVLVATATDRFVMVQASVDATGDPLPEVLVPLAEVKRVAVVLRSLPKATTLLEVSAPGDGSAVFAARNASVTTESAAENGAGERPRFVDFRALFEPRKVAEGDDPTRFAVSPLHLTRLAAIAKAYGEAMRIQMFGPTHPTHVLIGERCRAMVMPMRMGGEVTMLPLFVPPSELKRAEAKAAAKAKVDERLAAEAEAAEKEAAKARHPAGKKPAARKAPARTPAAKPAPRRTSRAKAAA